MPHSLGDEVLFSTVDLDAFGSHLKIVAVPYVVSDSDRIHPLAFTIKLFASPVDKVSVRSEKDKV